MKSDIWITVPAKYVFGSLLNPSLVGLEFGSGCSTLWIAERVKHLTSVEHDNVWYERVKEQQLENVNLVLRSPHNYVSVLNNYPDEHFDFVFNDGLAEYRSGCISRSWSKIKPGGFMVIDNSEARHSESGIEFIEKHGAVGARYFGSVTNPWNGRHNEEGVETGIWLKQKAET